MKISYMREYIELAAVCNYAKAASSLYISQPALSRHIAVIESEIGAKLFNRSSHRVELTEAGKTVLIEFKNIVSKYDGIGSRIRGETLGASGEITVGILYYAAESHISPVLQRFSTDYPNIKVKTVSHQPDLLFSGLQDGKIDVGFFFLPQKPLQNERLVFQKLASDALVVLSASKKLSKRSMVSISELENESITWVETDGLMGQCTSYIKSLLAEKKVTYTEAPSVENIDLLSSVLIAHNASTIIQRHVAAFHPKLKCIEIEECLSMNLYAVSDAQNENPAVPLFLSAARNAQDLQAI